MDRFNCIYGYNYYYTNVNTKERFALKEHIYIPTLRRNAMLHHIFFYSCSLSNAYLAPFLKSQSC